MQPCSEERRIARIEQDLLKVAEATDQQEKALASLSSGEAEMRVYLKQIFERLDDLKTLLAANDLRASMESDTQSERYTKIVLELIKYMAIIAGIVGGARYLS